MCLSSKVCAIKCGEIYKYFFKCYRLACKSFARGCLQPAFTGPRAPGVRSEGVQSTVRIRCKTAMCFNFATTQPYRSLLMPLIAAEPPQTDLPVRITKFSGELTPFDQEKLKGSLYKSGASRAEVEQVMDEILPLIYDGIRSRSLYQLAFKHLKRVSNALAARYSLKRALRDLGPAGYHFEKWVAKFFHSYGYQTVTSQLIAGIAVTHEADVIAQKGKDTYWIECKFRNTVDAKITVTTPMYLLSRIKDISERTYHLFGQDARFTKGWLVTNAYFTSDSIQFGTHYGIDMLSWDYPSGRSIKNLVDRKSLYPVTCLTTLSLKEKEMLLTDGCIMVKDLMLNMRYLDKLAISKRKKNVIYREVCDLLNDVNTANAIAADDI